MNHPKLAPAPIPAEVDVKAIRRAHPRFHRYMPITQAAFAQLYGFSAATVRDWEQGRRKPDALARALLTIIAKEPAAAQRALREGVHGRAAVVA